MCMHNGVLEADYFSLEKWLSYITVEQLQIEHWHRKNFTFSIVTATWKGFNF